MTDTPAAQTGGVPPEAQIAELVLAQLATRLTWLFATLKLADHLTGGPKTAEELASATGTHAPSLYRILRTLASLGFVTERADHRFALQPLGAVLKSGTPSHAAAIILGGEVMTRSLDHLLYTAQTGKTGFERDFGAPIFDWLGKHPEEAALFNLTMVGFHGREPAAVAEAYDFSAFKTLADIGGSTGNMLTTILAKHPKLQGILFDLPHVVHNAAALIEQRGLTSRVRVEPGSFFERVPAGADAYLMSHIIHDWNEDQCLTIFGNCRRAMAADGRVLIVEMVLPEGDVPHPGKMLDMVMLTAPGGEERTASQYRALLEKADLRMTRVVPTASAVGIVEAVPR
jgi:hypothetical protein